jgi:hypothetical protein
MRLPGFNAGIALHTGGIRQGAYSYTAPAPEGAIEPALNWGNLEFGTCYRANRVMQIGAILWGIPWGVSWEATCAATRGYNNRLPDSCQNTGLNIKGWWSVPCTGCCA